MKNTAFVGESVVHRTRRFGVVEARMRIRGRQVTKPFIRHGDIVLVLPITSNGKIILIKSYRPEVRRYVLEMVSGTLKRNEDPKMGAKRELLEEAGMIASSLEPMFGGYPMLGYSDAKYHFFVARGLEKGVQRLEKDEDIAVIEMSISDVEKEIRKGKIEDINIISAVMFMLLQKR